MTYDPTDEDAALQRGFSRDQLKRLQVEQGLSNRTLSQLSDGSYRNVLIKLDITDRPRARAAFARLQLVDETGSIPENAMSRALQQLDSLRTRTGARRTAAGVPCGKQVAQPESLMPGAPMLDPAAGLSPDHSGWTALGPGNIGGRTRAIVVHPTRPDTIWAASVGGGVWCTHNAGGSWSPVDDLMANLAVTCLIMDTKRTNTLYAGTGEGFFNVDALRGAGIFRTVNGVDWQQLPSTTNENFRFVNRLAMSKSSTVLLAGTSRGIFRSEDAGRSSWSHVLQNERIADVKYHPTDSFKAVAGGHTNGRAYFTTNAGKTWDVAQTDAPWSGRVELAYAVADPNIVYASVQMTSGEIWRSTDGGQTYSAMSGNNPNGLPANFLGQQGWYDNVIWAGDPTNADLVIVGGIDLWRSTDGGDSLEQISNWRLDHSIHADHHAIVSHPGFDGDSNKTVYFGNDGGVYRHDDVSLADPDTGWTKLNNNLAVTQFYGAAGHAGTRRIVGGTQDNGTLSYDLATGTQEWDEIFGGDGGDVASDPGDPQIWYGEYVDLQIFRNDNGATGSDQWWQKYICGRFFNGALNPPAWDWKPEPFQIPDARLGRALFIAPFILDPNDSDRLLGGGASLWRTNDAKTPNTDTQGPSWSAIKGSVGAFISAIEVAQGNSDVIWVGHQDGQVYRTANGQDDQPVWQRVDSTGSAPLQIARYCHCITIDPADHDVIYVSFGGYAPDNVWKSTNGGADWDGIGGALPDAPVRKLTTHPRKPHFVYAGTEVGVFASEDAGATWSPTNEGPTNCSVNDLFWMNEVLVCATHGRGMFSIDLSGV